MCQCTCISICVHAYVYLLYVYIINIHLYSLHQLDPNNAYSNILIFILGMYLCNSLFSYIYVNINITHSICK